MPAIWGSLLLGTALFAAPSSARPLTPAETEICESAAQCADILSRHGPEAFDYAVLADEFERLGPDGAGALVAVASGPASPNAQRLLRYADDALAAAVARRMILSRNPETRALGGRLVARFGVGGGRPLPLSVIERVLAETPSEKALALLEPYPFDEVRPVHVKALASGDTATVAAAYAALFADDPRLAFGALVEQMRATQDLPTALAVGRMIARRDRTRADGFYARMLDDIAIDRGYSQAMRDGARAGSLSLWREDAPLSVTADLDEQLRRLDAADAASNAFNRYGLARGGARLLPVWRAIAETNPKRLRDMLIALKVQRTDPALVTPFVELGVRDTARGRTVIDAIHLMPWAELDRFTPVLESLAETHPFDTVRRAASRKLDRDVTLDAAFTVPERLGMDRSRRRYCERGAPVDTRAVLLQLPPLDLSKTDVPVSADQTARGPATAFPTRTRWLVGYDRGEFGGALIGFDYQSGAGQVIAQDNVQFVLPPQPVPLGQQPETLWVMTGVAHMGLNTSELHAVRPDAGRTLEFVTELPDPVRRVSRLDDGSLMLYFHSADGGDSVRRHPPLRLRPDGVLLPGCAGERLVGEAPALFQP